MYYRTRIPDPILEDGVSDRNHGANSSVDKVAPQGANLVGEVSSLEGLGVREGAVGHSEGIRDYCHISTAHGGCIIQKGGVGECEISIDHLNGRH